MFIGTILLSVTVLGTEPKIAFGDGGSNNQVVYPDTIRPRGETGTNGNLRGSGPGSPMSGVTHYGVTSLTNDSALVTNRNQTRGLTNPAPRLTSPSP